MKRCLRSILLITAGFFSSSAVPGCSIPYRSTPPIENTARDTDVLDKGLEYIVNKDYAGARSYLEKFQEYDPSIKFAIAMSYAGDGNLFNGGLMNAGRGFERLIYQFARKPHIMEELQEDLKPLFKLDVYASSKKTFKNWASMFPRELFPMYAFMCTAEGDYESAADAWAAAKKYWPKKKERFEIAFLYLMTRAQERKDLKNVHGFSRILNKLADKPEE